MITNKIVDNDKQIKFDPKKAEYPCLVEGMGQVILMSSQTNGVIIHDINDAENVGYILTESELEEWDDYALVTKPIKIEFIP